MELVHVDTDIGGDPDDLCALAMLLGWPRVELAGVTTCTDKGGVRAGLASYALRLAGREDVPVAAAVEPTSSTRVEGDHLWIPLRTLRHAGWQGLPAPCT